MHVEMLTRTGFRILPYFMTFLISKINGEDLTTHSIRQNLDDHYRYLWGSDELKDCPKSLPIDSIKGLLSGQCLQSREACFAQCTFLVDSKMLLPCLKPQRTSEKFHSETTVMSLLRLTNTIYFQEWKEVRCFPQSAFIYLLYKETLRNTVKAGI